MIKAKLTGTSGAISSQLDSNEQQLEASLEKSTSQYVGGDGIDVDNGIISNTGVTSINGQTGDLDGFALSAEIPTKTSQLVNDSNYATTNQIPTDYYTQEEVNDLIDNVTVDLSDYYTKTESNDKFADKSEIPTSTSQLTNDSQFITNTVNNLTNYYKKTETYTQTEVNNLIGAMSSISFQVVDNLPSTGVANVIYLVPDTQSTNNIYDEYIWVNNSWELIGSTSVDLSNYYTKTEADNKFALSADIPTKTSELTNDSNYITKSVTDLTNYYDKTTINSKVSVAQDELLSMGEQLVINGSALMGDNTNFSSFIFDGSQANGSAGSFTKSGSSTANISSDKLISLNPAYKYVFGIDAKTLNGISTTFTYIKYMDIDEKQIMGKNTQYIANTLTTLSQDLNNGDTVVHLTDLTNWNVNTGSGSYYRGFIFWNYKNSYGYQYPAETYSRNEWSGLYIDTNVDKTNNTITLTNPWNHGTIPAGTQLSQHKGASSYFYVGITGQKVPQQWTHYKGIITTIPAGTAFAKLGFLLFYNNTASDQYWFTNISLYRAFETSDIVGLNNAIPTKTSDLTNDSNFQNATQVTTAINAAIGTTSNLLGDTEDLS